MNSKLESLISYMAQVDPRAVNQLAYKWGYLPPETVEERQVMMFTGLEEEGDEFLKDMARFHPDRQLVLNADGFGIQNEPRANPNTIRLNADGDPAPVVAPAITKSNQIDKSDMYRIIAFLIVAFVLYKIIY